MILRTITRTLAGALLCGTVIGEAAPVRLQEPGVSRPAEGTVIRLPDGRLVLYREDAAQRLLCAEVCPDAATVTASKRWLWLAAPVAGGALALVRRGSDRSLSASFPASSVSATPVAQTAEMATVWLLMTALIAAVVVQDRRHRHEHLCSACFDWYECLDSGCSAGKYRLCEDCEGDL